MGVLETFRDAGVQGRVLIGGAWSPAAAGRDFDVRNPADGSIVGTVSDCDAEDAHAAVEAACLAQISWSTVLAGERSKLMRRWAALVRESRNDLACLLTTEQGKPLAESLIEADVTADFIEWFAEEGRRAYGQVIPALAPKKQLVVTREPVGVAVAITPWNFPLSMVARKVAPAIAAGCATILKPSEDAPLTSIALGELGQKAGLPPGVLNVITCSRERAADTVRALLLRPEVRKVSFTGSTSVGKILLGISAETVKKVSMELGGNAPFLVFEDADIERALSGFMAAKFRNAGQVCISPNRLLLHESIEDTFMDRLTERVEKLRVGHGLETGTEIGPMISARALEKAMSLIQDAVRDGAQVITGGEIHPLGGLFLQPTVITKVNPQMRLFREEVFGPVVSVTSFSDETEAISLANDTNAGLAAYFFTTDSDRVWRVSRALQSGMIGINDGVISTPVAPFGGVKESGLGREGGQSGLLEYLEEKYLCIGTGS